MLRHDMVNSETPTCRNAPEKSSFENALVFFKKPSVLSELERSADATTIFSTSSASTLNTVADAARVAESDFCSMACQSILGSSRENHDCFFAANAGLASFHLLSFARLSAA